MKKVKRIVYIGGGTGGKIVLGGLKKAKNCQLTGVYPVTDNGGSTGKLLKSNKDLLPMGDLRKMLLALMPKNEAWQEILDFRFEKGEFKSHNLGNIIIASLQEKYGNIERGIDELRKELKIKSEILPVALKRANLCVELENGQVIKSETKIDEVVGFNGRLKIVKAWIEPEVSINPKVKKALQEANLIVIGPGDLYTSVAACLCISGVAKAIRNSRAKKVYICNLMTKFGQTNNFSVQDHVKVVQDYLGGNILDYVVYNSQRPKNKILVDYEKRQECCVEFFSNNKNFAFQNFYFSNTTNASRIRFIGADLLGKVYEKKRGDILKRSLIQHDSDKLTSILLKLC